MGLFGSTTGAPGVPFAPSALKRGCMDVRPGKDLSVKENKDRAQHVLHMWLSVLAHHVFEFVCVFASTCVCFIDCEKLLQSQPGTVAENVRNGGLTAVMEGLFSFSPKIGLFLR